MPRDDSNSQRLRWRRDLAGLILEMQGAFITEKGERAGIDVIGDLADSALIRSLAELLEYSAIGIRVQAMAMVRSGDVE